MAPPLTSTQHTTVSGKNDSASEFLSEPTPALFPKARCHHLEAQVSEEVDGYFIQHWPFPDAQAVTRFKNARFSQVTCYYYPDALDDRIHFACRLLTLLFLIDDILEDLSFEEGRIYNEHLITFMKGAAIPDPKNPSEYISFDLWESMRRCDKKIADQVLDATFVFMQAQTDPQRKAESGLGSYLDYRERDVGKALLSALMCFVMKLKLTPSELEYVKDIDVNCAKHISVINDTYSWEKELKKFQSSGKEGSIICSSVNLVAQECNVDYGAAKRVLWSMCKEWELVHLELLRQKAGARDEVISYCQGLGYQMSGNEAWSRSTKRYNDVRS